MATGEQLKALVKSYIERDEERFFTLALQVAAHEARRGHGKLATEIRDLIDQAKSTAARQSDAKKPVAIVHPRGELAHRAEQPRPLASWNVEAVHVRE